MRADTPSRSTANVDVAGVGVNATDTLIRLPHFPALDSKVEFLSAEVLPGGQVATALVACQRWGLKTRYIGKVGDDAAAELHRNAFHQAGVEAHLGRVENCASQTAYILVDEATGERTILWRRDARLILLPEELDRSLIVAARALHVDGHDTAAAGAAARWAREAGIPVTADVDNLYTGAEGLLENVDYLLASRAFPQRLTGEPDLLKSLPAIAERFGCTVAGATLGIAGVLVWSQDLPAPGFLYCPAYLVKAVDTTGAGDIFHAGFIYSFLRGWKLPQILEFSCAAAALNCTAVGARAGIRPVGEIELLMRSGQRHEPAKAFAGYILQRALE